MGPGPMGLSPALCPLCWHGSGRSHTSSMSPGGTSPAHPGGSVLQGTGAASAASALPEPPQVGRESRDRHGKAGADRGQIRLQAARGREIGREQQCSKKGF